MLEMSYFIGGIILLIVGYFTYGRLIEKVVTPTDRDVPSKTLFDGVDFIPLKHWKNMLIQLLNIAGIGPVIGVILGIKFGPIVFIIIPIGNIIGGAVHDYFAGMMSERNGGANLPELIRRNLGTPTAWLFGFVTVIALLLVVAVFINIPAEIISSKLNHTAVASEITEKYPNLAHFFGTPEKLIFYVSVTLIFLYYIAATMFPIDQIIGRIYPIFGAILIIGTLAFFGVIVWEFFKNTDLLTPTAEFKKNMFNAPIIPMLFVTIACGIISGFHATQAPIVARTMNHEREGRQLFYGMMIIEGIIAMIWAAVGLAIYNILPELMQQKPMIGLIASTEYFFNSWFAYVVIIGVVILAITSGDTAMRSLRLTLAECFHFSQKPLLNRILLVIPLIIIISVLLIWSNINAQTFAHLWNYFAWMNQVMAVFTLMAASVALFRLGKCGYIALLPGAFMCFVVTTFILWTSSAVKGPAGLGLPLLSAYIYAGIFTLIVVLAIIYAGRKQKSQLELTEKNAR